MNRAKTLVLLLISGIFLWLALVDVSFREMQRAFAKIDPLWLLLSFSGMVIAFIIRVIRWQVLLSYEKKMALMNLTSSFLIGLMVNNILPARVGELVRAYILEKKEKVSKVLVLSTIILERTADGLSVFLFFVLLLFLCPFPENVKRMGFLVTGIYILSLLGLVGLKIWQERVVEAFGRWPKVAKAVSSFSSGLNILGSLRKTALFSFYSLLAWFIYGLAIHSLLIGFGIMGPLYVAFFVLVMCVIGVMIPAAPGYMGTFQYFCTLSLVIFGYDKSVGFSYSLILYIISFFPITFAGIFFMLKEGLSFSKVLEIKREERL
jgi:hypothetical protein